MRPASRRLFGLAAWLCAVACLSVTALLPACAAGSPYDLVTSTGTIHGTLTMPDKVTHPPVVLIIAGSGPTDRDGNSGAALRTDAYRMLAEALAQQGIAAVRYDKRGIGESKDAMTSEADLRFDDYVDDAAGWVAQLRHDGRFASVTIVGHSEGSLIGMIAARKAHADAFVSLEGAGRPAADIIASQMRRQLADKPELISADERILESLEAGEPVTDVPAGLSEFYRPSVQPYLISWFRHDPRVEIAKLHVPVTIVQGTADIQIPVSDAKALARALPSAKLVIVNGMSHVLKHAGDMSEDQQAKTVYADPSLPLDTAVPQAVVRTIQSLAPAAAR